MIGRSLDSLCAALGRALLTGDADALRSLYLPTAVIVLGDGEPLFTSTPEEAALDRARLGLPIRTSVRSVERKGGTGEVVVDWSVDGVTPDGTELELSGDSTLECAEVGGVWCIASERLRCHDRAAVSSGSRNP